MSDQIIIDIPTGSRVFRLAVPLQEAEYYLGFLAKDFSVVLAFLSSISVISSKVGV